jgi:glycosyltransferase involved in cell wall biosynthesis/peptidoglycan/xylan/chitin deacetylase (PgdA/CDA1 family)
MQHLPPKQRLFSIAETFRILDLADNFFSGGRRRLCVLNYHRVDWPHSRPWLNPGIISATPDRFEQQMRLLARRFHPVGLEEVLHAVDRGASLPAKSVLVTVDDGYRDFQETILPIAARYAIRPVLFVTTGFTGQGSFWWDTVYRAIFQSSESFLETEIGRFPIATPADKTRTQTILTEELKSIPFERTRQIVNLLAQRLPAHYPASAPDTLTWDEMRALDQAGAYLCAHTHTHPILSRISVEEARAEICQSQAAIRNEIGHAWPVFAFPEGKLHAISPAVIRILREEGFRVAFSTEEGGARLDQDSPLCLPRVGVWTGLSLGQFHFHCTALYRRRRRPVKSAQTESPPSVETPRKKFLLVRAWEKPPFEKSMVAVLADAFPEYAMETFALGRMLKRHPAVLAWNGVCTLAEYGGEILRRKQSFHVAFYGTPYLFRKTRELFLKEMLPRRDEFAFSILTHSLFDVSQPGLPHYVYTDRTMLANLYYPDMDRGKLYSAGWIDAERDLYRHATIVFTRSADITRSLTEQYDCPREKVVCAYAGFNAQPLAGELENDGYRNQRILFVGTDWNLKGGPELVRAFRRVRKAHPDARLTVVGPNIRLAEPGIDCVGLIPLAEVSRYYHSASIFCLPTTWEAFGIAFLEAMANKLPVIGTNLGAIPDFIIPHETGLLVGLRDEEAIAEALMDLLGDPEKCRRMGQNGYRLATERYNWKNVGGIIREHVIAGRT